jgi:hypothetical protein
MINEDQLRKDTARATRAKQLLEDELINEAFAGLEAAYINAWRTSIITDINAREKLFLAINVVGKVREHLQTVVANGSLATKELEDLAKLTERRAA